MKKVLQLWKIRLLNHVDSFITKVADEEVRDLRPLFRKIALCPRQLHRKYHTFGEAVELTEAADFLQPPIAMIKNSRR